MTPVSYEGRPGDSGGQVKLASGDAAVIPDPFLSARRTAAGLSDYPGDMPSSLDEAYAIQDAAIAAWKKPIIGWKVGRVPPALVEKFGEERLAGPIFASRRATTGGAQIVMPVFEQGF